MNDMKAIQFSRYGGPDVLTVNRVPSPTARAGEVAVEVHVASVNPIDWKLRSGLLQKVVPIELPMTSGRDGAGVICAVGDGVSTSRIGQRVCFIASRGVGTWAERIVLPGALAVPIPDSLSMIDAAALPLGGLSAWAALVSSAPVGPGRKVLVHAGAGGVGSMAIQLAHHRGAYVATTCSAANIDFVKSLGADQPIAYDEDDFSRTLSGFDIVFDTLGGEVHRKSYAVLRKGGTMVCLVAAPFENQAETYGVTVKIAQVLPDPEALARLVGLAAADNVKPIVGKRLAFDEFAEAHRLSEYGHGRGKIVLTIR
ncbi:MAG: NADP-dependent oxidoreductase [Proteobacteria bacterium]|nr:NADP-dependent oxidoreductase [Pseudomonadota bacterium]